MHSVKRVKLDHSYIPEPDPPLSSSPPFAPPTLGSLSWPITQYRETSNVVAPSTSPSASLPAVHNTHTSDSSKQLLERIPPPALGLLPWPTIQYGEASVVALVSTTSHAPDSSKELRKRTPPPTLGSLPWPTTQTIPASLSTLLISSGLQLSVSSMTSAYILAIHILTLTPRAQADPKHQKRAPKLSSTNPSWLSVPGTSSDTSMRKLLVFTQLTRMTVDLKQKKSVLSLGNPHDDSHTHPPHSVPEHL